MITTANAVLQGCSWGHTLGQLRINSEEVARGKDPLPTAISQCEQIGTALNYATSSMQLNFYSKTIFDIGSMVMISSLTYFVSTSEDPSVKKYCQIGINYIGPLCDIINVVTTISILFFGNTIVAVSSLAMFSIAYLNDNGSLPERIENIYRNALSNSLFFVFKNTVTSKGLFQILYSVMFVTHIWQKINNYFNPESGNIRKPIEYQKKGVLSKDTLINLLNNQADLDELRISLAPLQQTKMPDFQTDDIDYKAVLINLFKSDKNNLEKKLQVKSGIDERMQGDANEIGEDYDPFSSAESSLEMLLTNIKERSIPGSMSVNYDELEKKLTFIANYLQNIQDKNPVFHGDALIQLAVEAGEYCQPKIIKTIRAVYRNVCVHSILQNARVSPTEKLKLEIYLFLMTKREQIFQQDYFVESPVLKRLPKSLQKYWQNEHIYNMLLAKLGASFGLPDNGETQDSSLNDLNSDVVLFLLHKLPEILVFFATGRCLKQTEITRNRLIDQYYQPELVTQMIDEELTVGGEFPFTTKIIWWLKTWINNNEDAFDTLEQKATTLEQLECGRFVLYSNHDMTETAVDIEINYDNFLVFIRAMLVDFEITEFIN